MMNIAKDSEAHESRFESFYEGRMTFFLFHSIFFSLT